MYYLIITLQILIVLVFLVSGVSKSIFSIEKLVQTGQTAVEDLDPKLVRLVGILETLGAIGLILPAIIQQYQFLMSISAICLGLLMVPAAFLHYKREEHKVIFVNVIIIIICAFIALWYFKNP